MDRLEMGIFTALIAMFLALAGIFIQVWDLPRAIQQDATAAFQERQGK